MTCLSQINGHAPRKIYFNQSELVGSDTPSAFLRRHFAGKPVVASWNIGCFLGLLYIKKLLANFWDLGLSIIQIRNHEKTNKKIWV